jgi:hypothetical protein
VTAKKLALKFWERTGSKSPLEYFLLHLAYSSRIISSFGVGVLLAPLLYWLDFITTRLLGLLSSVWNDDDDDDDGLVRDEKRSGNVKASEIDFRKIAATAARKRRFNDFIFFSC